MKKTAKKIIAVILCIAMMTGILCMTASAATPPEIKYVAIGDSASMGYQLDDFASDFQHNVNNLTGKKIEPSSKYSVYSKMVNYLTNKGYTVDGADLSMTGMRTLELRSILDKNYYENHKSEIICDTAKTTFWGYHMWDYLFLDWKEGYVYDNDTTEKIDDYAPSSELCDEAYANIHKVYTEKIKEADVLTIDLTMNDFGTYFGSRFIDIDNPVYANETFANIMKDESNYPAVGLGAEALRAVLEKLFADSDIPVSMAIQYIDAVLYSYANFAINFSKSMDIIYRLNPCVDLTIVGPYNTMDGLTFKLGNIPLDFEMIWGALNEAVTAYVCAGDRHSNRYKFADLSGKHVDLITDVIARGDLCDPTYKPAKGDYYNNSYGLGISSLISDGANEAVILENLAKAAKFTTIPLTEVLGIMGNNDALLRAMKDFDNATDAERGLLHVNLRFAAAFAIGSHPSKEGYDTKAAAVIKAYESHHAADGTYLARVYNAEMSFVEAIFNVLLGKPNAINDLKLMILDLFAPITKVFNLIGSFGG